MTNPSNIERIVMQRVHLIRALRVAVSTSALSTLVLLVALWGLGREVWVSHVLQNAPQNPASLLNFYIAAFAHTRLVVQALILLMFGAFLYLVREIIQAVSIMSSPESI